MSENVELFKSIVRLCLSIAALGLLLSAGWATFHHNLVEATFCLVLVILYKVMGLDRTGAALSGKDR